MKYILSELPMPKYEYPFFQPKESIVFFDIETTGLSPKTSSLYLIGAVVWDIEKNSWNACQWFADDYQSEEEIITSFFEFLKPYQVLYHFNGYTFDIPYVLEKCKKYHIEPDPHITQLFHNRISHQNADSTVCGSVDLLKEIRKIKKTLSLKKANQTALEIWLGVQREDTYNGGELIKVYAEYMQKKIMRHPDAQNLENILLLHNHDDLGGMLDISSMLSYADLFYPPTPPKILSIDDNDNTLSISFHLSAAVPRELSVTHCFDCDSENIAILKANKDRANCILPLYQKTLKFFFDNYRDYYYLPEEDTAIHKSVAQFVDAKFRKKATASTCYTHKAGFFFPLCCHKKGQVQQHALARISEKFLLAPHYDQSSFLSHKKNILELPVFFETYHAPQGFGFYDKEKKETLYDYFSNQLFSQLPFF